MKTKTSESTKKLYKTPVLSVYGDVREITQALTGTMGNDHAGGEMNKTS
jgi:hypothetical protein